MKEQPPQQQLIPPQIDTGAAGAAWTAWVREQWSAVHVVQLDVTQFADITDRVRVRAVIQLGSLSPADVCVEAVAGAAEPGPASGQAINELWSAQSYRNGTFVFEGFTAVEALDDHHSVTVRVRPRRAHEELSGLSAVARSTEGALERGAHFSPSSDENVGPDRKPG